MYINMLSDYLIEKFGEKFYRISLNGGMSCPNRDGTCGTRGCLFCSESGAGEFTPNLLLTMDEQITYAKKLVSDKPDLTSILHISSVFKYICPDRLSQKTLLFCGKA